MAQDIEIDRGLKQKAAFVHQLLLEHFGLPAWNKPLPVLDELVSTILSQNTNDRNRDTAFFSLRRRYKTWEEVRDANPAALVETIRSAGLANQKAPRIQQVLRQITEQHGSLDVSFLSDYAPREVHHWLMSFNGVGPKTAAIVMLFSLGIPAFPVDTHIYRVTGRLGLRSTRITVEQAHTLLESLFQPADYAADHLNIIRLGREICQARRPQCNVCPLQEICDYYKHLSSE